MKGQRSSINRSKSKNEKTKNNVKAKLHRIVKTKQPVKSRAEMKALVRRHPLTSLNQLGRAADPKPRSSVKRPPVKKPDEPMADECEEQGMPSGSDTEEEEMRLDHLEQQRNPQMVSCYADEIFAHLVSLESVQEVRPDYLRSPARLSVTPRMRAVLFDWLVQVHQRFSLQPETLYLALHMIDYFMSSCCAGEGEEPPGRGDYQLLGISAMFLAAKYEEVCPPEIVDFVYLSDDTYTAHEIRSTERTLLCRLGHFLGYPLPVQYLRRFGHACSATQSEHEMAKYLAELGVCAYSLAHLPPSGLAAAAVCLARCLLRNRGRRAQCGAEGVGAKRRRPRCWRPGELLTATGFSEGALWLAVRALARLTLMASDPNRGFGAAVRKKYSGGQMNNGVSAWPEVSSNSATLLSLARDADDPDDVECYF